MLETMAPMPVDGLVEIGNLLRKDRRPDLIDLGVGVYRDAEGRTPIASVVKTAERLLLESQTTKSYVAPDGDPVFTSLLCEILLGSESLENEMLVRAQAPGGTGALRIGMELIAKASPGSTVHLGLPSWPNHAPMLNAAGLRIRTYGYYDSTTGDADFGTMLDALTAADDGDVVLLHGCCHNPSGADLSADQWGALSDLVVRRGLIPLIDIAYQGLGDGLDEDARGIRKLIAAVPEALVATSCSKSFGLYRERTGMLVVKAPSRQACETVRDNLQSLARLNYSNPPDHGAAVVRTILSDDEQKRLWREGLERMRQRLLGIRERLATAACPIDLSFVRRQKGLFALLPLEPAAIERLRTDHGIYMTRSGRINIAGLNEGNLDHFVHALASSS